MRHSLSWVTTVVNFATALDDELGVSGAGSADSRATATLNADIHSMIDKRQLNHIIAAGSADTVISIISILEFSI